MAPTPEPHDLADGTSWCIATRITVCAISAACIMLIAVIAISHWQFAHGLSRDRLLYLADELAEMRLGA